MDEKTKHKINIKAVQIFDAKYPKKTSIKVHDYYRPSKIKQFFFHILPERISKSIYNMPICQNKLFISSLLTPSIKYLIL